MSDLTHVDESGAARMVDVTGKPVTSRVAVATGVVRTTAEVVALLASNGLKKGDAIAVARTSRAPRNTPGKASTLLIWFG